MWMDRDVVLLRTPGVLAWLRPARVFQKVDRASAEHLARWDLSVAQFDVLAQVGAAEGMTHRSTYCGCCASWIARCHDR